VAIVIVTDAVRALYVARWGEPSKDTRFKGTECETEILEWNKDMNPEGVRLYATVGASALAIVGSDTNHRVEFFLGLLPAKDAVASPLAALACYPVREGVALDHGHTVPSDAPLWPGTDMRRLLVLRPINDIIPALELPDGLHVEFLQAIPIFESEFAYKAQHDAEALLRRWEESKVPFWDPDRAPEPGDF
jgi:hypothetical protein